MSSPSHHHTTTDNGDSDHNSNHPKNPKLNPQITQSEIRSEFSHHDPTLTRINNGSFGCCPSSVISAHRRSQLLFLSQPDAFYSTHLRPSIDASRRILLSLLNAPSLDSLSLVDNATTASAVVLHHVSRLFSPSDAALVLHHSPGSSVKTSVHTYISRTGAAVIDVPLPFPVYNPSAIVAAFRHSLDRAKSLNRRVRLAVIDHITSTPCVVLPIKDLVGVCREENVDNIFVDGAHGIGCVPIDVQEIGADFYTTNLHKWFFCPPSVAVLYCRKRNQVNLDKYNDNGNGNGNGIDSDDDVHHPVVSYEYGNGLPIESASVGTRDFSTQLVVPDVLEFVGRFEGGLEGIMRRNHEKVVEMGEMLVKSWGTHLGCSPEMCASMIMVGLPNCLGIRSDEDAKRLRTHFRKKFRVEVPLYYRPPLEGEDEGEGDCLTGYARISHQVYNTVDDFYKFRDVVNQLVQEGFTCAQLSS